MDTREDGQDSDDKDDEDDEEEDVGSGEDSYAVRGTG